MDQPQWWEWDLEFTPHIRKRMVQRNFNDIAVREMLDTCRQILPGSEPNRWTVESTYRGSEWHIIVEPDPTSETIVIITAYPIG